MYKKFKVFGIDKKTGKNRRRTLKANDIEEVIRKASDEGIIVEVSRIEEIYEPATERQIRFAMELGLSFSENISKYDMHKLLDKALSKRKYRKIAEKLPPTEAQIETAQNVAKELGIKVPKGLTRKEMTLFLDKIMDQYYDGLQTFE